MDAFDQMLAKWQPIALSLFRFVTGLLLFHYGTAKILGFPVVPMFAKIPPLIQAAGTLELVLGYLALVQERIERFPPEERVCHRIPGQGMV